MATKRRFMFDVDQLTAFCKKCKPTAADQKTVLEVKDAELERLWAKLIESCDEVVVAEDSEISGDIKQGCIEKFNDANEKYQACKQKLKESMKTEATPKADMSLQNNSTTGFYGFPSLKLPPCDTPPFEGGYSKWPAFRDIFEAVFGKHPELTPAQKLYHLRAKTRGEAFQIVTKFDLVDENFDLAWEALKNRYENPRILIHQQMKQLFSIPVAQSETTKTIRQIQSGINDSLSIFQSYKIKTENWDPILVHLCSSKLPDETLRAWEDSLTNHKELPTWKQMSKFLSTRIEIIETICDFRRPSYKDSHGSHQRNQVFHSQLESEKAGFICKKCNQNHPLRFCSYFKALAVSDRINYVYENKFCSNCLSHTHFKAKCTSNSTCSKCNKKHHTMLHLESNVQRLNYQAGRNQQRYENNISSTRPTESHSLLNRPTEPHASVIRPTEPQNSTNRYNDLQAQSTSQASTTVQTVQNHFVQNQSATILPTALIDIDHAGELFTIRALLDAGSEKSFISKRIQQTLGIPVNKHHSQISGLGGTIVGNSNGQCVVKLTSKRTNFSLKIQAIVVSKISHFLPSQRVRIENLPDLQGLCLADPQFYVPAPIDMIIGSDYLPMINLNGVLSNIGNCLEARESRFGWYLSGPLAVSEVNAFTTMVSPSEDVALQENLKKFWEVEEVNANLAASETDKYCEEFYIRTTSRQKDGRFVVRLPFKLEFPETICLGPSRNIALAVYHRMEKSLSKTPELKTEYNNVLKEYVDLDHMEPVKNFQEESESCSSFYLPHHAVIRPESKTTKVRVVFNGSKRTKNGLSLNDVLYPGPVLQSDLMEIILNWRHYQFVFTGDIQKMYRQIVIHDDDRPYQRILYRPEPNGPIKTFALKTVTFGINCAPFLAIRTLRQLSEDCQADHPKIAEILKKEIYVDDVLSGGHTLEEAKFKQHNLIEVLKSAAFPLKKLAANNISLLENLAREDLQDEDFLRIDNSSTIKTLGIRWNAMSDKFYYVVQPVEVTTAATKRSILSTIARLFDPLGWLGPIVVIAKMLMQKLWEDKSGWDDGVPPQLLIPWNSFLKGLPHITSIQIPRWVNFAPEHKIQIHGFCDASEKAYCGTVYLRTETSAGEISSHLLVAKTRVAPIKQMTIPKLELCGALLLSRLISNVTKLCNYQFELFLWTDSSIVLGWLQKPPQTLKTFVANRVTEINNLTGDKVWNHVKTDDNPSDLGTRGCLPQDLVHNLLWWHGPVWLKQPIATWPEPLTFESPMLELKKVSTFHLEVGEEIISRFSSLDRALRVICYVFRFVSASRKQSRSYKDDISTEEITCAKNRLISVAQKVYYSKEYECLKNKGKLSTKSHILTLTPFLDKDDLLRVGGRLENAGLSYEERHPVIIPEKSHYSELLVQYTHKILLHSEFNIMMRAIRQGFYIPKLKNLIRKCIRNCKPCTIYKRKFQSQLMGALPPERVTFSLPFTYTGVDFAGPFHLKSSLLRNAKIIKGYAAVFVCFSTRAVHLEVCSDLSADAFLAAFIRFTGRRGLPKTMFSDNGRNFVGASHKLLQEHNLFLKSAEQKLAEKYTMHGFSWSFIPPYAPHMGGLWEAAVKSMKAHLEKTTSNLSFTFEEFTTVLIRIEAVLNSRPLSPMSNSPTELLPLTPGHLLRGAPLIAPPESTTDVPDSKLPYLNRWNRLKTLQHLFCQRWKSEYITELQRRYKWKTTKDNLKENDLVIIKEDHLPPTEWRLGRVTTVIYGKDDKVRAAEIKTQNGIIKRPIVKLCLLPNPNVENQTK